MNRQVQNHYELRFPGDEERDQDEEWCEVKLDDEIRRIRFHDYDEIYAIPGLYEQLFYEELKCSSPEVVREMLSESLEGADLDAGDLRVLDVGAGNGIVGEELNELGIESLVGVDIIAEAAEAAERDRPDLYDDYHVIDLTDIPDEVDAELAAADFNCLTSVAALGFDDMPPEAFAGAHRYLGDGGLVAFSIKADFVARADESGFAQMMHAAIDDEVLDVKASRRYVHRISATGEPLHYMGIVAQKRGELVVPEASVGAR